MAVKYGEEARSCVGAIYGFDSERYGVCTQNIGSYYQNLDRYDKAKDVLLEALEIFKNSESQYLLSCYTNLLPCYAYNKDWEAFDDIFHLGGDLLLSNNLEETEIASNFWGTVGYCLFINGSPKSKDYFLKALNISNTIGNSESMEFLNKLIYYCTASFLDNSQTEISIPVLYEAYKNLYLSNAAFFNDSERSSFVTSPKYSRVKDVLFSTRSEGTKDSTLFDYLLFSKGLLLGTSRNYAKAVYDSGNDDVIHYYTQMQSLNRFINGEVSSVPESTTIEEARAQASVLERQITLYLRENGGYTDRLSYTYSNIQESLRANEVAIEFLTYHDFTDDTDYYAAMIAGAIYDTPQYVKLCKKTEIEALASLSPDKLYGESSASEEAYKLIWAPLAPYLTNIKTVYFSPAGYINKMAVEHLYNGEKRFDSLYKVLRLTSTRELCSKSHQYKYSNAVLYGGLQYDEDDATMIAESRNIRGSQTTKTETFRGFDSSVTRKGWEYLPGTLEEVNQISSIISRSKVSCDVYSSEKGNEESFKALSGNNFGILHIATHGFYMTASQAERSKYFTSNPFNSQGLSGGVSPLQRAGLLLSGGNKAWRGETVPEGVEDGILTAAEIASLDLNSCDVVVLSACETGLGEITDEGVFGLQRAFKNAGVNTIIMSLWEVDDKATSLMMQSFYRNLMKGTSKRDSFTAAQNDVRKKCPDPRYWAAFIMLD